MRFIAFLFPIVLSINCFAQEISSTISDSLQRSLAFELLQIFALDQGVRHSHVRTHYPEESTKIMLAIDSINFTRFIDIVKKYGFPSRSLLGNHGADKNVRMTGVVILLHNPRRLVEEREIYHLLRNEVIEGRLNVDLLVEALDKYYVIYHKKSIYNSQFKSWPTLPVKGVSIVDKHLSDSLRMDIGLPPLTEDEFIYADK
jgi:hypothetical protein